MNRIELAKRLKDLFPKGKKNGTNIPWTDSPTVISLRLERFEKLFDKYSDEQIYKATKAYVDSFQGNYSYMRVLRYFIFKDTKDGYLSDLDNYLNGGDTMEITQASLLEELV